MNPDVEEALSRVMQGRGDATDVATLQRALLGYAPSSTEYRMIVSALGTSSPGSVSEIPGREDQGSQFPWDPESSPTLDFAEGIPTPWEGKSWPSAPGAGGTGLPSVAQPPAGSWEVTPLEHGMAGRAAQSQAGMLQNRGAGASTSPPIPSVAGQVGYSPDFGPLFPADAGTGLSGVEKAVYEMQKNQGAGGGGNQLNTAVQGGPEPLDWDPTGSIESFSPMPHSTAAQDYLLGGTPEGYTFSDMSPEGVALLHRNPATYLNQYAKQKGGGEAFASFLDDPRGLAELMSSHGLLGQSYRNDLSGGIYKTDERSLTEVEDFLNAYNAPGMEVNTGKIYQDMLTRAGATDFHDPQTQLGMAPDQIVNTVNEILVATTKALPRANQEQVLTILNQVGQQYLLDVASGAIQPGTVSYPKYLEDKGLRNLLG